MPRGKKSVKIEEPVVNEAEVTEAEEVKTTVEVTANPETTEPENVTITRDENGKVISVQPTQELIDQQNAEVEEKEEELAGTTTVEINMGELDSNPEDFTAIYDKEGNFVGLESTQGLIDEANTEKKQEEGEKKQEEEQEDKQEADKQEEQAAEQTVESVETNRSGTIASQVITDPFGRKTMSYKPQINNSNYNQAGSGIAVGQNARRGEVLKHDGSDL